MPDISMCSPSKFLKKCYTCYRYTAKPDTHWQSYSNFYDVCRNNKFSEYIDDSEYPQSKKRGKPLHLSTSVAK